MNRIPTADTALYRKVISNGYCIGCGACASVQGTPFAMARTGTGIYQAGIVAHETDRDMDDLTAAVCPFLSDTNENQIAAAQFADQAVFHDQVGYYNEIFCGHITDENERLASGSGGLTIWLARELLRQQWIDGVIHVTLGENPDQRFEYAIQQDDGALNAARKSRYYPIEFSSAVKLLRAMRGKRFAFIGVPCFVKAIHLLCRADPEIRAAIRFTISIFCGHLKSAAFGEFLAWRAGVPPAELENVDFRWKIPGRPANRYGIRAQGKAGRKPIIRPVAGIFGADWGLGYFKPKACDYCDDITGETADVSFGDAWLPEAARDYRGTNIVAVRNSKIGRLFEDALAAGTITLSPSSPEDVVQSQAANYRHRHVGLSYRLRLKHERGEWTPPKRIQPGQFKVSLRYRLIFRLRARLAAASQPAYEHARRRGSLAWFDLRMLPYVSLYYTLHLFDARRLRKLWQRVMKRA
jgi:coenzyme F420 hydrogenase subunit beta